MKKKSHSDSPVTSITLKPKCMNITTVHCLKCKSAVACPSLYRLKIKLCLNDDSLLFIFFDGFVGVVGDRYTLLVLVCDGNWNLRWSRGKASKRKPAVWHTRQQKFANNRRPTRNNFQLQHPMFRRLSCEALIMCNKTEPPHSCIVYRWFYA